MSEGPILPGLALIHRNLQKLNARRKELRMSFPALAARSGVSEATVKRILSGRSSKIGLDTVEASAEALGMRFDLNAPTEPDTFRQAVAAKKAAWIMRQVQGTSALEAQALPPAEYEAMLKRTEEELLKGPSRRLWSA